MSRWILGREATRPLRRDLRGALGTGDIASSSARVRGLASMTGWLMPDGSGLIVASCKLEVASSFARSAMEDRGSAKATFGAVLGSFCMVVVVWFVVAWRLFFIFMRAIYSIPYSIRRYRGEHL